jgi:hypothetical protein
MSDMATPRRWTLSARLRPWEGEAIVRLKPEGEQRFAGEVLVRVVEEEPMLDLLERVREAFGPTGGSPGGFSVVQEVGDLLSACGRA